MIIKELANQIESIEQVDKTPLNIQSPFPFPLSPSPIYSDYGWIYDTKQVYF